MDDTRLALDLLETLDFAVLRRTAPRQYVVVGRPPAFYQTFFPGNDDAPCASPWTVSPMLEFFLDEAEEFFELGQSGSIASGVWEEDGLTEKDTGMTATAINLGRDQVIVVRLLRDDYAERLGVLRKAREQLLENRALASNLSIFKEKSRIDGLTSIFNRATFIDLLLDEIRRSQIMEYPLCLMILDIDDFKKVNDTYGHLVGDEVLRGMGALLKQSLRRNDIVARYGGEEFAVLVPHAPIKEATAIADTIRLALADMSLPDCPRITVSIGCSAYVPEETAEMFFKRTDDALYEAKKTGKNRVCVG